MNKPTKNVVSAYMLLTLLFSFILVISCQSDQESSKNTELERERLALEKAKLELEKEKMELERQFDRH